MLCHKQFGIQHSVALHYVEFLHILLPTRVVMWRKYGTFLLICSNSWFIKLIGDGRMNPYAHTRAQLACEFNIEGKIHVDIYFSGHREGAVHVPKSLAKNTIWACVLFILLTNRGFDKPFTKWVSNRGPVSQANAMLKQN